MPKTTSARPSIRTLKDCVILSSVWNKGRTIPETDDNRAELSAAVSRGDAEWVNDASPTGNTANA
jgi:hypothetical protein